MNITLIGMPAVGKSSVGEDLARFLKYKFLDIDKMIVKKEKKLLQKVLDNLGDEKFIKLEGDVILSIKNPENTIFSPGGSIIYNQKAMEYLKNNSTVIFLESEFSAIEKRLSNAPVRGIVGLKNKSLKKLFEERTLLYKKYADITIKVPEHLNKTKVAKEIISLLGI